MNGSVKMVRYLFDTNILIYYFNGEMEESVADNVSELMKESFEVFLLRNKKNSKRLIL